MTSWSRMESICTEERTQTLLSGSILVSFVSMALIKKTFKVAPKSRKATYFSKKNVL